MKSQKTAAKTKRCSRCRLNLDWPGHRYCRACHAEYMRGWRPKHSDFSPEQKRKANARSYANAYQFRGKLIPQPCQICGSTDRLEKHHEDYSKPLEVIWLCRAHHLACEMITRKVSK